MRNLEHRDIESVFDQLDALGWISQVSGPRSDSLHGTGNPEVHRKFAERAKREKERREQVRNLMMGLKGQW